VDVLCSTYAASHGFPEAVCEDECLSGIVGGEVAERVARDHLGPDGAVLKDMWEWLPTMVAPPMWTMSASRDAVWRCPQGQIAVFETQRMAEIVTRRVSGQGTTIPPRSWPLGDFPWRRP
jgi:hypothetical protein